MDTQQQPPRRQRRFSFSRRPLKSEPAAASDAPPQSSSAPAVSSQPASKGTRFYAHVKIHNIPASGSDSNSLPSQRPPSRANTAPAGVSDPPRRRLTKKKRLPDKDPQPSRRRFSIDSSVLSQDGSKVPFLSNVAARFRGRRGSVDSATDRWFGGNTGASGGENLSRTTSHEIKAGVPKSINSIDVRRYTFDSRTILKGSSKVPTPPQATLSNSQTSLSLGTTAINKTSGANQLHLKANEGSVTTLPRAKEESDQPTGSFSKLPSGTTAGANTRERAPRHVTASSGLRDAYNSSRAPEPGKKQAGSSAAGNSEMNGSQSKQQSSATSVYFTPDNGSISSSRSSLQKTPEMSSAGASRPVNGLHAQMVDRSSQTDVNADSSASPKSSAVRDSAKRGTGRPTSPKSRKPEERASGQSRSRGSKPKYLTKIFVICCSCKSWHDLPSDVYARMVIPDTLVERKLSGSPTAAGVNGSSRDRRRHSLVSPSQAPALALDNTVKCAWCYHGMSKTCCESWTTLVHLLEKHH